MVRAYRRLDLRSPKTQKALMEAIDRFAEEGSGSTGRFSRPVKKAAELQFRRKVGDRYYYLDGKFWDRVSNTPEQVANELDARIVKVAPIEDPILGHTEVIHLESKHRQLPVWHQGD